ARRGGRARRQPGRALPSRRALRAGDAAALSPPSRADGRLYTRRRHARNGRPMSAGNREEQAPVEPHGDDPLRRELYFFALYRALEGALLVFVVFSPVAVDLVWLSHPAVARGAAVAYLICGLMLVV